jgi:hypothetical protein
VSENDHLPHVYEGPVICVTLQDGTRLYKPQTLPERHYTRMYDQIMLCGANERSTEEILTVESFPKGVLETYDRFRSPSMRRWKLVDLLQENS